MLYGMKRLATQYRMVQNNVENMVHVDNDVRNMIHTVRYTIENIRNTYKYFLVEQKLDNLWKLPMDRQT